MNYECKFIVLLLEIKKYHTSDQKMLLNINSLFYKSQS
jgi:hypothetical protein